MNESAWIEFKPRNLPDSSSPRGGYEGDVSLILFDEFESSSRGRTAQQE